ncbi:MAG: hypothetical protein ACE5GN_07685, partial [Waddliaceae bacterium]
ESVDIAKETNVMIAAIHNGLYTLSQKQMHAKVVVFLQQINHATLCCSRIIQKVFADRIEHFAEVQKSKDWFNDEWVSVIEGIKREALSQLPSGTKLDELEGQCTKLFETYLTNLQLFEKNPEMYHVLADREWLRRNIILRAEDLILLAEGDRYLIRQVENIKQMAINFVDTLQEEQQIRERANLAFDLILDRIRFKNQQL